MSAVLDTPYQIASFRLSAMRRAATLKADHGLDVMRGLTVAKCADQWMLHPRPRTWQETSDALLSLEREVEAGTAPYGEADGIGYFCPMSAVEAGIVETVAA